MAEPDRAAQGMRELREGQEGPEGPEVRGGIAQLGRERREGREGREEPLEAAAGFDDECPAMDELRASFRSAVNRILAQSHGIYDVALRSSPSQSHAEAQRGEELGALLHQIIDKWVQYSQEELEDIMDEAQLNAAFACAARLQLELQVNRLPTTLQKEAAGMAAGVAAGGGGGGPERVVALMRMEGRRQQAQAVKEAIRLMEQAKKQVLESQQVTGAFHGSQSGPPHQ
ncbi:hypothetical protein CLOM_g20932 [Closterium sp. NIES-68]|nr:hypothetical protein CLOM_g20932 [Closterium sp. NIES-68]